MPQMADDTPHPDNPRKPGTGSEPIAPVFESATKRASLGHDFALLATTFLALSCLLVAMSFMWTGSLFPRYSDDGSSTHSVLFWIATRISLITALIAVGASMVSLGCKLRKWPAVVGSLALGVFAVSCFQPLLRPAKSAGRADHAEAQGSGAPNPAQVLQEIRQILPKVSAPGSEDEVLSLLPAHFSPQSSEHPRHLSGEDLYLFPDRSFLYIHGADIEPPTIYDNGTWSFSNGVLELNGDRSFRQSDDMRDRHFIPLYFPVAEKRTLLLMGLEWQFPCFRGCAKRDNDHTLFPYTFTRIEPIDAGQAEALRTKLWTESYRWPVQMFTDESWPLCVLLAVVVLVVLAILAFRFARSAWQCMVDVLFGAVGGAAAFVVWSHETGPDAVLMLYENDRMVLLTAAITAGAATGLGLSQLICSAVRLLARK
jgi:hypothetical protein